MHREMMILVCHDADGHFTDGNRAAIRRVLDWADYIADIQPHDSACCRVICLDAGQAFLRAPGLNSERTFHRIEVYRESDAWTPNLLMLVYDLMCQGGFGLMDGPDVPQFIVTQPQQVSYYPWLPQPPLLVRSADDLGQALA